MGNQNAINVKQQLLKDGILKCPKCSKEYNHNDRIPLLMCNNQHNICQACADSVVKGKKCFECKDSLVLYRRPNKLLLYIVNKMYPPSLDNSPKYQQAKSIVNMSRLSLREENHSQAIDHLTDGKVVRVRKLSKTRKRQSVPDLNMVEYNEEKQFRKKYSVAAVFKNSEYSPMKIVKKEETIYSKLKMVLQKYNILAFQNIVESKRDPLLINHLELHLNKIDRVFQIIPQFKNLQRLNLNKNKIKKIQNLSTLTNLTYLSISQNNIELIQGLAQLNQLKNLYLNKNRINKIQNISDLGNIEFLGLGYNIIQKIQNLERLTKIKWLNLEFNYISKIEGIQTLANLEIILLGHNEITIFETFDLLPLIQQIHLEDNKIDNLGPALKMKNLRKLKIENNPGLNEDNIPDYVKLLQIIEAKSKGIDKTNQNSCQIY